MNLGAAAAAFRHPSALRAGVGRVLDVSFELSSPLPVLPRSLLAGVSDEPIALPSPVNLAAGNQDSLGLQYLVLLARLVEARRILEIGTYNGLTALTLAVNLPAATIETLDLPPAVVPRLKLSRDDAAHTSSFDRRFYVGTPYEKRIVQHLGDSATFDFASLGGSFDLVYVDGAHTYDYVANDTRAAFSLIAPGGVVVWDDYWRRIPDVARFLHGVRDRSIHRIRGTRLAVWLSDGVDGA